MKNVVTAACLLVSISYGSEEERWDEGSFMDMLDGDKDKTITLGEFQGYLSRQPDIMGAF